VAAFTVAIGAPRPKMVPISAKFGDNVVHRSERMPWYRGPSLLALLEELPGAESADALPFRFPVQQVRRAAAPDRAGGMRRQYLGRIAAGQIRVGDEIVVMPAGSRTRIRSLATYDGDLAAAAAPKSLAIEVADDLDIGRGDILAAAGAPPRRAMAFDATLCWLSDDPFTGCGRYLVKCGTRTVAARITSVLHRIDVASLRQEPAPPTLERNDIAQARFAVAEPMAIDPYCDNRATGGLIVIDADTKATVAAAMISAEPCSPQSSDPDL